MRKRLESWNHRRLLSEAAGVWRKLDIVIASAIVEHIPYPRQVILGLLSALSPGVRAYFRTPAMASLIKLAARFGVAIDFIYPAHVHDMGQPLWENLLASLNVDDLGSFAHDHLSSKRISEFTPQGLWSLTY